MTEVTYHCINFNDRVRKVPKIEEKKIEKKIKIFFEKVREKSAGHPVVHARIRGFNSTNIVYY
jgi:hypothetical protein